MQGKCSRTTFALSRNNPVKINLVVEFKLAHAINTDKSAFIQLRVANIPSAKTARQFASCCFFDLKLNMLNILI